MRLQLSMLLLPSTTRANFWAAKLTSLVAFEQLKRPNVVGPCASIAARKPVAARSSASSQVAGRRSRSGVAVADERLGEPDVALRHARSFLLERWDECSAVGERFEHLELAGVDHALADQERRRW